MTHTSPAFPVTVTAEESDAGFRRMALSLGNYVGADPHDNIEVVARPLTNSDVVIKTQAFRQGKSVIRYRHLRYGLPSRSGRIRNLYGDIRFGGWIKWFRGRGFWKRDWQHVPAGEYDDPKDNCLRTLRWRGAVGVAFQDHTAK